MASTVILTENLSKSYRLGAIGTGTFYGDLKRWWASRRGKPDPYQKIGEAGHGNRDGETIWALKDINLTVRQGEALGIIGRNGAGKSTLLKILSQVTAPTRGVVNVKGRIASLLEVGTGFHPELTGRENIYLNGAIMGMDRAEVSRKFDEIVDFSGIEKFIDTPVKRYSSGMYVRLAFAVAAHLEPDILVVDEVLAVGDYEFQKQCLGKMNDVTQQGRTVLFVSHNMGAILSLCERAILLIRGEIDVDSNAKETVSRYLKSGSFLSEGTFYREQYDPETHLIESVEFLNSDMERQIVFDYGEPMNILLRTNESLGKDFGIIARIKNSKQEFVGFFSSWIGDLQSYKAGQTLLIQIPRLPFVQDTYYIDFICNIPNIEHVDNWWDSIYFSIGNSRPGNMPFSVALSNEYGGIVFDDVKFSLLDGDEFESTQRF